MVSQLSSLSLNFRINLKIIMLKWKEEKEEEGVQWYIPLISFQRYCSSMLCAEIALS